MKRYLLIVGYWYYPSAGTEDWIGIYNTYEEALQKQKTLKENLEYKTADWYSIIDLNNWENSVVERIDNEE